MKIYNTLKYTLCAISILNSPTSVALSFEPIHIQSSSGDLLYAEMKFSHALPQVPLELALANAADLDAFALPYQRTEHLIFFIRPTGNGSQGHIVITSSQPISRHELNLFLKIKQGNDIQIQHIRSLLPVSASDSNPLESSFTPQRITDESEIALKHSGNTAADLIHSNTHGFIDFQPAAASAMQRLKVETRSSFSLTTSSKQKQNRSKNNKQINLIQQEYVVHAKDSLWRIAAKIAAQTHQHIPDLMQHIQHNNQHAFIDGDRHRIRQGATLYIPIQRPIESVIEDALDS